MNSFEVIQEKLNAYIQKYYTKQLLKGVLLFLSLGLLVFLAVTAVEYVFWLASSLRLVLLLLMLLGFGVLIYQYIGVPLLYLFKVKEGISKKDASRLIGKHFPQVGDRLANVLDLYRSGKETDLLLAAIDQKSKDLKDIPFINAVSFGESWKYAKYLLVPAGIVLMLFVTGRISDFFGSYQRVVNYDLAYSPPAPFTFQLRNENLNVLENEALTLELEINGKVRPENVNLVIDGKPIVMQERGGRFKYTLAPPLSSSSFYFTANDYDSRRYELVVGAVPAIAGFEMSLNYPKYLGKRNTTVKGSGNAIVPEGTEIVWKIKGVETDLIEFSTRDTVVAFNKNRNDFTLNRAFFDGTTYHIATSNNNVKEFEKLGYRIEVVPDEHPTIKVEQQLDSLNPNSSYYSGLATDDNKVTKVQLAYYPVGRKEAVARMPLLNGTSNVAEFYYTFPSGITLEEGVDYELYFEVVDNDGLRGGKITKSQTFRTSVLNDKQLKDRELDAQQSIIDALDNTLEKLENQEEEYKQLSKEQKESSKLDFNKQNKIKDFLKKQELQESLMEKFSKQLNENLEKNEQDNELKKLLQERLERQELEAAKNKKLLEELNKVADKIDQEDLKKRLEEIGKKQRTGKRNLEQLVELTKRFYVTERAAQLAEKLKELSEEQKELGEEKKVDDLDKDLQKALNKAFEELAKELDELQKDNQDLKKPLDIKVDDNKKEAVKQDQKDALEELNKPGSKEESSEGNTSMQKTNEAAKKQKSAAQKMQELSEALEQSASAGGGGSSITEDAEMLRQILDNLITFSFKQEQLFDEVQESEGGISQFASTVRKQKELRGLFEHVDDSLFALSLRRAELSEVVNENITEVYYNIDKSLESIADNKLFQGASYQQYVLTAGNTLADFLANLLDNMQQSMQSGKGQGQGDGFQLPDIIKGQKSLSERMQQGNSSGQKGEQGQEGDNGKQGESGEGGEEGEGGKQPGNTSENGNNGKEGKSGEDGKKGQNGTNGEQGQGDKGGEGGTGGAGNGLSEQQLKEIYEIYKEQQAIRQQLEQQLKNIIANDKRDLAKKLVRQMESFENDLLENGITQLTLNKMNAIQHQLLKLENAALKQGKKKERESKTNNSEFQNTIRTPLDDNNKNTSVIEILNRQALPLRQNFQNRVKDYFKRED